MIYEDKLEKYLTDNYTQLINKSATLSKSSLIEIPYEDLNDIGIDLEDMEETIQLIEEIINEFNDYDNHIYVQIKNVPQTCKLSEIDAQDVGKFISTTAMIQTLTNTKPELISAVYQCKHCKSIETINKTESGTIHPPAKCSECGHTELELNEKQSIFDNNKILRLEEPLELRKGGNNVHFKGILKGYLAGANYFLKAGDTVNITGILGVESINNHKDEYSFIIDLKSIKPQQTIFQEDSITPEEEKKILEMSKDPRIFEKLTASIAPNVYKNTIIKEGLVLQQFGAGPKVIGGADHKRGTIHILLIGDPGLAKTLFLNSIHDISLKVVRAGNSSTEAGLTAAVIKDETTGQFVPIAGAAVSADMGTLIIDEYDKVGKNEQMSLNEMMESMTITIAKAGVNVTLSARANLLAAANPKLGRFDKYKNIHEQIDMPQSTLNRFDLTYILRDELKGKDNYDLMMAMLDHTKLTEEYDFDLIPRDLFMKYIAYATKNINPVMTDAAKQYIASFYQSVRGTDDDSNDEDDGNNNVVGPRNGMGIVRLSIARAKAELSEVVTIRHVKDTIRIYSDALRTNHLTIENAGRLGGDLSENDLRLISACEDEIKAMYNEVGSYNFSPDDIAEIKDNIMDSFDVDENEVTVAFNKAFSNFNIGG